MQHFIHLMQQTTIDSAFLPAAVTAAAQRPKFKSNNYKYRNK